MPEGSVGDKLTDISLLSMAGHFRCHGDDGSSWHPSHVPFLLCFCCGCPSFATLGTLSSKFHLFNAFVQSKVSQHCKSLPLRST